MCMDAKSNHMQGTIIKVIIKPTSKASMLDKTMHDIIILIMLCMIISSN